MCEVLNTAVRKAVAQERQKVSKIRKVIKAKDSEIDALHTELEKVRKEKEDMKKLLIAAGYSI